MLYTINKLALLQEDMYPQQGGMSPLAKKGAALLGVGAAGALAHAGTFGTGAKNFVDGAASAGSAMAQTAGHKVGESLNDASKFYGGNGTSSPTALAGTPKHETEQNTHNDSNHYNGIVDHNQQDDDGGDDSGYGSVAGVLGTLGAIGAAKGIHAFGKSDTFRNYRLGSKGYQTNGKGSVGGMGYKVGAAQHNAGKRFSAAYKGFKTGK